MDHRRRTRIYSFRMKNLTNCNYLSLAYFFILVIASVFILSVSSANSRSRSRSHSSELASNSNAAGAGAQRIRTSFKVDSSKSSDSRKSSKLTLPPSPRGIFSSTNTYKQSHTYKINSKPCDINNNNNNEILRGTCMFVWECIKSEGKHLGMCIDGFMFGSCCSHNDTHNVIIPGDTSNDNSIMTSTSTSTSNLPFVTSNSSIFPSTTSATASTTLFPWTTTTGDNFGTGNTMETETIEDIFTLSSTTERVTTSLRPRPRPPSISTTTAVPDPSPPFVTFTEYIPEYTTTTPKTTTTTATTTTATTPTTTTTSTTTEASVVETLPAETQTLPSTTRPEIKNDECGVAPLVPQKRIVGGKESGFGSWPWIVSVRRTSFFGFSSTHRCGGTLINENWVITAGHCVDDLLISQIRVRIGEWDFSAKGGDGNSDSASGNNEKYQHIERGVLRKVVHGSYNFFTYENDLALLYLDGGSVNYSQHIRPLCLQGNQDLLVGHNATVAGWGRLSEGGILPNRLQQVTVPIMSNEECRKLFLKSGRVEHIPDIFLCAGYSDGGRDSCQGDSGGPLMAKGENQRWFLAGIISWGIGCAEPNMPGVCTRISKFTEWILKHVN